ncbi:MAG TPA: CusA/CzcA family heavy metal efflux RND transporter [Tenuifilaceae bacterium]|nr:CusA/CzcA family heavy metal efflux RND transporter [Tenuifilaceae bacterium]HPQ34993.1 CusA/CzcA family heavy metal efflux RND transporter [Tenuifilaceae bacterium]HRX68565.1 CusA/CzcA family heavy metal efflux RND transporter [Tenuifilaceae bacterium]
MLEKIVDFSVKNKLIVILFTLTIAAFGIYAIIHIPVGAVPDVTNNQVQVITTTGNLSTSEVEQYITAPVELEMANLPGVVEIRSISKFGLSVVTIVFDEKLGAYLPRQLIAEKIKSASANIPEGFGTPEMGPITTGLGEIYQYILDVKPEFQDKYSPMDLRTIQDWIVRRQLSGIKGVVEVNSWGGYLKQYEVAIDPLKLKSQDVTLMDVFDAMESNNSISGGAYIEKTYQSYFIRGDGTIKSIEDIENIVVANRKGIPLLVKDVAEVRFGFANRYGAITANGEGEKVLGQIMMLKDANSKEVIQAVHERVAEVQQNLPEGVFINPILDRSDLISKTSFTVVENLVLGCLIVVLVVVLLLGNFRSALVIASMIPLALLFTLSMMYVFGIDANLMSLGALDFGIIIDGAVIIVEFIAIKVNSSKKELSESDEDGRKRLLDKISFEGASKMMSSAIFGQIIILIVFIPILSLSGVEGKMFKPMALSFSFAIIGAMILGLTWLPVAASLFLKPEKKQRKGISDWFMGLAHRSYAPVIAWSCRHKRIVLGAALVSLILTGFVFSRMGGEFVPTLDEGDFVIQPVLKTGTSLSKTVEMTTRMEQILIDKFPEVDQIVCRIGAAEVPTDPMSMEEIDMIIRLKPRKEWVSAQSKEELADRFKEELSIIPGIEYEFTQPIEMRFNELITGVRADIAIKIYGEDLEYLNRKAIEVKNAISDIPGAADVILEKTAGLPQMSVVYNRKRIAYYGLNTKMLNEYLAMAFGGESAGSVFEGEKRFDMVIRLNKSSRVDIDNIEQLMVPLENGKQVPLKELAEISYTEGPAKISRDNTQRRVVVSVNVRNRDLKSVVEDIQSRIDKKVKFEPGYYISYGGQFENLQNATNRLLVAVPVALLLIFVFLHFAFKSLKDAIMIFTAVPLATVGGVFLLWIRGMPFSVSAGIGFIALFGIAVLNGIVLIEHLKELLAKGEVKTMRELILQGTHDRLRPVMLTAAAAAMGFLPMAISTGAGAEVQRPLATVVIGGLVTSTMLTMIALPLMFEIFYNVVGFKMWPPRFIRSKSIPLTILLIFIAPFISFGQQREVKLDEAIQIAMQNNKEIKAYELMVDEQRALRKTGYNIEKTNFYYSFDQNNVADNGYPLGIFGVEQTFSFPTIYSAQRRANSVNISIAEVELEKQRQNLTKQVSKTYYRIVYLQNKLKVYQKVDSLYSSFGERSEKRYEKGDIGRTDLLNAKAKQHLVQVESLKLKREIEVAYSNLKTLLQIDDIVSIPFEELVQIPVNEFDVVSVPEVRKNQLLTDYQRAMVGIERNSFLPDFSLGYFNGTNRYAGAQNYYGFEVGVAIPLFFGEQKAKVKASRIAQNVQENMRLHEISRVNSKYYELKSELAKFSESIQFYNSSGRQLSDEILRSSQRSYELGEMSFFEFVYSVENALSIKLEYLDNLTDFNNIALEINYITE